MLKEVGISDLNAKMVKNSYKYNEGIIEFDIEVNPNSTSSIELPRIYYLGYDITVIDNDGNVYKYDTYCKEGLLAFDIDRTGHVIVEYKGTLLMNISKYLCACGVVLLIGIPIVLKILDKKKKIEKSSKKSN